MKGWFAPSLLRWVLVATLIAVGLVWCLVMVLNFVLQFKAGTRENRAWVEQQGALVEQFAARDEASRFLSWQADYYFRNANQKILIALLTADGQPVSFTHRRFDCPAAAAPNALPGAILQDGKPHATYRFRGQRWSLCVAFPVPGVAEFVAVRGKAISRQMAVGVCLVLPAFLLAIKTGLLPVARLSQRLESRHADDLGPVQFDATYLELKPLVAAIDALLLRLRNQIAHEQIFVENAAHELRTPLAVIAAQKDVLIHAPDQAARQAAQQKIGMALGRAQHLVGQLRELARIDRAGQVDKLPVDVTALTQQALAQLAPVAAAAGARLACRAEPGLIYALEPQSYLSILINLIDNAIRYGQAGVRVEVELLALADGALELRVSDDGPGIAMAERERVFERFYRGLGHEANGSGLGLSIVREAARRLGGKIGLFDGINERGCRFVLSLPGVQETRNRLSAERLQ